MDDSQGQKITARKLRVYFLGSGIIAVPALSMLAADNGIQLVGCGTQPDRPQGRKRRMMATPVGQYCAENQIPIDKPDSANSPEFLEKLKGLEPDIILVFAFGQILSSELINLPPVGCINVHASLLPKYRGASPVNAAILAGDSVAGITIMRISRGLDAGPTYKSFELNLSGKENAQELSERLAELAAANIGDALQGIADGTLTPEEQETSRVSYARKISKSDGQIDWTKSADEIERMVRGYYPWPGASFTISGSRKTRRVTVTQATVLPDSGSSHVPGQIIQLDKSGWIIACGRGALRIETLVPEGKREMSGTEFIRGCPMQIGNFLDETNDCQSREHANSDCINK